MDYFFKMIASPVGELTLIASEEGIAAVLWENENPSRIRLKANELANDFPLLRDAEKQLGEYFTGQRTQFSLKLAPEGTVFQRSVWQVLQQIPYGETRSYQQVAALAGYPRAVRAVGAANGRNPLSILVPCHRVIGANGKLTGFAGGLETKAFLLDLESGRHCFHI
ncbi:MAG: Methylated-DNA--protein-cysteine methyltransferase, constitutive [Candidatus Erwinia impunctatus]|nr:Methylated-DNA--protein-cysteine methyltransferase, constitutive [Culicoides impunctatus]